jgi:hypothetical protein
MPTFIDSAICMYSLVINLCPTRRMRAYAEVYMNSKYTNPYMTSTPHSKRGIVFVYERTTDDAHQIKHTLTAAQHQKTFTAAQHQKTFTAAQQQLCTCRTISTGKRTRIMQKVAVKQTTRALAFHPMCTNAAYTIDGSMLSYASCARVFVCFYMFVFANLFACMNVCIHTNTHVLLCEYGFVDIKIQAQTARACDEPCAQNSRLLDAT